MPSRNKQKQPESTQRVHTSAKTDHECQCQQLSHNSISCDGFLYRYLHRFPFSALNAVG